MRGDVIGPPMIHTILRQIEDLGYTVSVHTTPHHTELHAVRPGLDEVPHVARSEGTSDAALYEAARALAEMVGARWDE